MYLKFENRSSLPLFSFLDPPQEAIRIWVHSYQYRSVCSFSTTFVRFNDLPRNKNAFPRTSEPRSRVRGPIHAPATRTPPHSRPERDARQNDGFVYCTARVLTGATCSLIVYVYEYHQVHINIINTRIMYTNIRVSARIHKSRSAVIQNTRARSVCLRAISVGSSHTRCVPTPYALQTWADRPNARATAPQRRGPWERCAPTLARGARPVIRA